MSARKKLTDAKVRWIRNVAAGRIPYAHTARIVGCSPQHVSDIINRKRRVKVKDHD